MNPIASSFLAIGLLATAASLTAAQTYAQLTTAANWPPTSLHQQQISAGSGSPQPLFSVQQDAAGQQQFLPAAATRQPIAADLQNQVHALSAQIAAANRQLQYFQQQLSLATGQQQQQAKQLASLPQQPQQQPSIDASIAQQLAAQQQQQQLLFQSQQQQPQQPPQEAASVSTLVDNESSEIQDARFNHQPTRLVYQHQQQQQPQQQVSQFQHQQQATSTTVGPPSIEPSLVAGQEPSSTNQPEERQPREPQADDRLSGQVATGEQPRGNRMALPAANQAPPHNPPRNDDKFSIGLGVLSPGYTQKFGNTALDFNQDKDGFSFTLSNNGHNNQPQQPQQQKPSASTT